MGRKNLIIIIFVTLFLAAPIVFIYLRSEREKEPEVITASFKIEVYRVDRYPLPNADIYLDQRFIGRTDEKGFFLKDIELFVGESYTLRVERDAEGYVYGPWETNFKVQAEKKKRREKKIEESEEISSLEGESDILTEIERAQLGKASVYEKYHFLALVEGYMFYQIRVAGKDDSAVEGATIIVNGKDEGTTDKDGVYVVKYSGEDKRKENIQIFKDGEHIWMNEVMIQPEARVNVELNKMLLIDLYVYTEHYDVIKGVPNADVFLGHGLMGSTDEEGFLSFKYINNDGVDGPLDMVIDYPGGYLPKKIRKYFNIKKDLPKLSVINFAYSVEPVPPKLVVMPFKVKNENDYFLSRQAASLKSRIEDYLAFEDVFLVPSSEMIDELFNQFNVDLIDREYNWKEMPLIKKEVDGIIFGEIEQASNEISIYVYGFDYTGQKFIEIDKKVSLRELQSFSEDIANSIKNSFPVEGNIVSVGDGVQVNLGKRQGINLSNKFYGFKDYFDERTRGYSKKRLIKLGIVDTDENLSFGELEDIAEGYLLEPGVKVKRYPVQTIKSVNVPIVLEVISEKMPVQEANIYLNDHWAGQTDIEGKLYLSLLQNESAELLIYRDGFVPGKLDVKAGDDTTVIRVDLKRGETLFSIDTLPPGGLVFINETYKGTAPITDEPLVISFGFHLLEVELEGYKKYRNYINFNKRKLSLTGKESITLFPDYFNSAENTYSSGNVQRAVTILTDIPKEHPDYLKAIGFLGFIYLNDIKNYSKAIEYYVLALGNPDGSFNAGGNLISYYNLARAHYNVADKDFYVNKSSSQYNFLKAVSYFSYIRGRKNRLPGSKRSRVYQDTLFYLAVSYQRLYYLTSKGEYLSRAHFSWLDYFDFFNRDLLKNEYFRKQYSVADSYRKEASRLKSEK